MVVSMLEGCLKIRKFEEADLGKILDLTIAAFDGVSIEQNIERKLGTKLGSSDWQMRKARAVKADIARNPAGALVAELEGKPVGFVTCSIDRLSRTGRIAHLAVLSRLQRQGIGGRLIQTAFDYFRCEGMDYVRIETLEQNEFCKKYYPRLGFQEIARQIYYIKKL